MSFCTAINCMDGRVQLPTITFLQTAFNANMLTGSPKPGPVCIFARTTDLIILNSIFTRVDISVRQHGSQWNCCLLAPGLRREPADDDACQKAQLKRSVIFLKEAYPNVDVIGLWIDDNQQPQKYC